jgi:hypothetical protein
VLFQGAEKRVGHRHHAGHQHPVMA